MRGGYRPRRVSGTPAPARRRARLRHGARGLRARSPPRFRRLRRRHLRHRESSPGRRLRLGRCAPLLRGAVRDQLDSAHVDLARPRPVALRRLACRLPRHQCAAARRERGRALPCARERDGRSRAGRVRGRGVRRAPVAGRVRRLGERAQGRPFRLLLRTHAARLGAPTHVGRASRATAPCSSRSQRDCSQSRSA